MTLWAPQKLFLQLEAGDRQRPPPFTNAWVCHLLKHDSYRRTMCYCKSCAPHDNPCTSRLPKAPIDRCRDSSDVGRLASISLTYKHEHGMIDWHTMQLMHVSWAGAVK